MLNSLKSTVATALKDYIPQYVYRREHSISGPRYEVRETSYLSTGRRIDLLKDYRRSLKRTWYRVL